MTPRDLAPLAELLGLPCPAEVDPRLWRRCQRVLRDATTPATATAEAWPVEGYADMKGVSREEAFALRHLEIDPFA